MKYSLFEYLTKRCWNMTIKMPKNFITQVTQYWWWYLTTMRKDYQLITSDWKIGKNQHNIFVINNSEPLIPCFQRNLTALKIDPSEKLCLFYFAKVWNVTCIILDFSCCFKEAFVYLFICIFIYYVLCIWISFYTLIIWFIGWYLLISVGYLAKTF